MSLMKPLISLQRTRGFTLYETVMALGIVAVLATILTMYVANYITHSNNTAKSAHLQSLNRALEEYRLLGGMTYAHSLRGVNNSAKIEAVINALKTGFTSDDGKLHNFLPNTGGIDITNLAATGEGKRFIFYDNSYKNPTAQITSLLAAQGTPADAGMLAWLADALAKTGATSFWVFKNPTAGIIMNVQGAAAGEKLEVNWGDGNTNSYTMSTTAWTPVSHTYASAADRGVVIVGKIGKMNSYNSAASGNTSFGGDISTMTTLTYFGITGANTMSGSVEKLTNLTWLAAWGSNTLTGSVEKLTNLTVLQAGGGNTLSGPVTNLTNLTQLSVQGANKLTGSVTNLTNLTDLSVYGYNTLSGSVNNLTKLTTLIVQGYNTVTGSISNLTGLTMLSMYGYNTTSGSIAGMTGLQYILQAGSANFDYSGVNWSNLPSLSNVVVKNMTQSQVDSLLEGMWYNKDATKPRASERTITCTGGCAAPSATGLGYKTNLQGYKTPNDSGPMVWTVNTN